MRRSTEVLLSILSACAGTPKSCFFAIQVLSPVSAPFPQRKREHCYTTSIADTALFLKRYFAALFNGSYYKFLEKQKGAERGFSPDALMCAWCACLISARNRPLALVCGDIAYSVASTAWRARRQGHGIEGYERHFPYHHDVEGSRVLGKRFIIMDQHHRDLAQADPLFPEDIKTKIPCLGEVDGSAVMDADDAFQD